jgi:hypothetical protein
MDYREACGGVSQKVICTFTKFAPAKTNAALISSPIRCHSVACGTLNRTRSRMRFATRGFTAVHMTLRLGLFDWSGNVINTYEQAGQFKEP